jgi:hypothetical protein
VSQEQKKRLKIGGAFLGLFAILFFGFLFGIKALRADTPVPYSPVHSITQAEAEQLIDNYEHHSFMGTLKESPRIETFDPTVIEALKGLLGKELRVIRGAHEDGSQCSILNAGEYYFQKASLCPPLCNNEVSSR